MVPDAARRRIHDVRHRVTSITSDAELDQKLLQAAELFETSDDDARAFLRSFRLAPPSLPRDPFSKAYVDAQWSLYRRIARRDTYLLEMEETDVDPAVHALRPYPFITGSFAQVAEQLAVSGFLIRRLEPKPGDRIVEFGAGWGNLTLPLAQLGADVTAVEVGAGLAEILRRRAVGLNNLTVVHDDMLSFASEVPFDIALFFESFHHCSDHLGMLQRLRKIVRSGGRLALAAEPITSLPFPWGLRLDGMSLWCTRSYGWLELGFDNTYFAQALKRTGWVSPERFRSRSLTPLADLILLRR